MSLVFVLVTNKVWRRKEEDTSDGWSNAVVGSLPDKRIPCLPSRKPNNNALPFMNSILPQGGSICWCFYSPVVAEAQGSECFSELVPRSPACFLSVLLSISLWGTAFLWAHKRPGWPVLQCKGWIEVFLWFSCRQSVALEPRCGELVLANGYWPGSTLVLMESHCWGIQSCCVVFCFPHQAQRSALFQPRCLKHLQQWKYSPLGIWEFQRQLSACGECACHTSRRFALCGPAFLTQPWQS